jgi:hypothetical protein
MMAKPQQPIDSDSELARLWEMHARARQLYEQAAKRDRQSLMRFELRLLHKIGKLLERNGKPRGGWPLRTGRLRDELPRPEGRIQGGPEFANKKGEGEMKYTWKVIHEVVGKLEGALNAMQNDGFDVYRILAAGEMGTTLEMGTTFVVVGRKKIVAPTAVR